MPPVRYNITGYPHWSPYSSRTYPNMPPGIIIRSREWSNNTCS